MPRPCPVASNHVKKFSLLCLECNKYAEITGEFVLMVEKTPRVEATDMA